MDDLTANISQSLESVCRQNKTCGERFKDFLSKQIWTVRDRNLVLDVAAQLFFDSNCTIDICHAFRPVLLEVLHRTKTYARTHLQYQHLSIALSKVLNICPDAIRFSLGYFQLKSPFFTSDDTSNDSGEPVRKKAKKVSQ
ncbi:midasin-like [Tubulanus polymorphus]|uniref:midasin-like n=1 Tax=Tubulanus polymorphus TaxID=672921 RepID=UPI003DA35326